MGVTFRDYWDYYMDPKEATNAKEASDMEEVYNAKDNVVTFQELAEALETIMDVTRLSEIQDELVINTKIEEMLDTFVGEGIIDKETKKYLLHKFETIEKQVETETLEKIETETTEQLGEDDK